MRLGADGDSPHKNKPKKKTMRLGADGDSPHKKKQKQTKEQKK